jgi:hypothetical protein
MPSTLHQALIELFRERPELAPDLLADTLGLPVPEYQDAVVVSGDLTDLTATEYRADAAVMLTDAGLTVMAVVVEVQPGRDIDKPWTWPVYLTTLRARLRCPTVLFVVCVDPGTARWCSKPIDLGHPGWQLRHIVLSPERVPLVTDPETARRAPELTVLSALAHANHPDWDKVAHALADALTMVKDNQVALYTDVAAMALPEAARRTLEAMMRTRTYEYQSDFVRRHVFQGRAEGRVEGEARAVLGVLEARGIPVSDEARERITACTDLDELDAWVRRAVTVTSVDELFA